MQASEGFFGFSGMGHVIHDHLKVFFVVLRTHHFHEGVGISDRRGFGRHDHHNVLGRHVKVHDIGRNPGARVNQEKIDILFQVLQDGEQLQPLHFIEVG